jgi:hypothetical protein
MAKPTPGLDPKSCPNRKQLTARVLDPYGLDATRASVPAELVSDLLRLIVAAEHTGLRPARAAQWRRQLLSTAAHHPPDLLAHCEQRLRGWLLRHVEQTGVR